MQHHRRYTFKIILLFAGIILFFSFFIYTHRPFIQTIPITLTVGHYAGFNLTSTELNFGTILPGGTAERQITLVSLQNASAFLSLHGIEFITMDEQIALLQPGIPVVVHLVASVPENQTEGVYRGTLDIRTQSI